MLICLCGKQRLTCLIQSNKRGTGNAKYDRKLCIGQIAYADPCPTIGMWALELDHRAIPKTAGTT